MTQVKNKPAVVFADESVFQKWLKDNPKSIEQLFILAEIRVCELLTTEKILSETLTKSNEYAKDSLAAISDGIEKVEIGRAHV